ERHQPQAYKCQFSSFRLHFECLQLLPYIPPHLSVPSRLYPRTNAAAMLFVSVGGRF
ncbi:hypothetical protein OF83DRAFT_1106743, partial [Amylostereum chailletii]